MEFRKFFKCYGSESVMHSGSDFVYSQLVLNGILEIWKIFKRKIGAL